MSSAEQSVLLYDQDCDFCRWWLDKILAWDRAKRVRPVAIQSEEGSRLLAPIAPDTRLDSWHLVRADGRLFSAGAAAKPLARLLPGGRPSLPSSRRFPASPNGLMGSPPAVASGWRASCASTQTAKCVPVPEQTSRRAKVALATLVAGYFAMAVVAGAPNSPLTVLLPSGAAPPTWARFLADSADLANVGRRGLTAVAWVLLVVVVAAFAVVVSEAWSKKVGLAAVLTAASCSLLIVVAGPLLLSRDVYTYAGYGRIEALYGGNPYLTTLSAFPHDRFVAVTSVQWLHTHSH